jgi:hypothetical protein
MFGPLSFLRNIVSGAFAAAGAAAFSQFPAFVQQYMQRLGGHRDEALRFVENLKARNGVDTNLLAESEKRLYDLSQAIDALAIAGNFSRPRAFVEYFDPEIVRATAHIFQPAVPLTPEGFVYAGIGVIVGVMLFSLITLPFALFRRRRQHYGGY